MNRYYSRGLFLFALTGVLGACQKEPKSPVIAKVGSLSIPLGDLESRMADTPPAYQSYLASPEGRKQFLDLMVREKVLLIEAKKAGIDKEQAYKEAVDHFKEQWQRRLNDFQESLMVQSYLRKLRSKEVGVTDSEVAAYYKTHEEDFTHPREIQASHILLSSQDEAEKALSRIKQGEPFEKVARLASRDTATAAQGGRMAPFQKGALPADFESMAFKLKNGEVSDVVKTTFGYHLIKKTGEKTLRPMSLEEAKEDIRSRMEREKFDQWVTAKQTALGVHIDEKLLAGLSVPPQTIPTMNEGIPQESKP